MKTRTEPQYEIENNKISVWIDYFDYVEKYNQVINGIDGRHYNKKRSCWEFPLRVDVIKVLNESIGLSINEIKEEAKEKGQVIKPEIMEYNSPVKPYDHQRKAVSLMDAHKQYALFMEMGTGKTKCVIDWFTQINKTCDTLLVICPKPVIQSWEEGLQKHGIQNYTIVTGTKQQRIKLLEQDSRIYIINYEGVLVLAKLVKGTIVENRLRRFCNPKTAVVLDESSKIKNPQAIRTKIICRIFQDNIYKFPLSGTPVTQNPIDVYPQFKFCNPEWLGCQSWYAFRNYYCIVERRYGYPLIVGYRNLKALQSIIGEHALILKKKDCLDLPDKVYEARQLEMKPNMLKQYKEMKENLIIEINNAEQITAPIILTKLLRLQQIISGCWMENSKDNLKLQESMSIIKENINGNKMIIWCRFVDSIKLLSHRLEVEEIDHVTFFGETVNRQEVIKQFQTDTKTKVFIGNLQVGGMGLNLQVANLVIYFENNFSLEERWQSEDRCHRIGQVNKVTYIDLIYKNSIDEDILKAIRKKAKIANYLIPGFSDKAGLVL